MASAKQVGRWIVGFIGKERFERAKVPALVGGGIVSFAVILWVLAQIGISVPAWAIGQWLGIGLAGTVLWKPEWVETVLQGAVKTESIMKRISNERWRGRIERFGPRLLRWVIRFAAFIGLIFVVDDYPLNIYVVIAMVIGTVVVVSYLRRWWDVPWRVVGKGLGYFLMLVYTPVLVGLIAPPLIMGHGYGLTPYIEFTVSDTGREEDKGRYVVMTDFGASPSDDRGTIFAVDNVPLLGYFGASSDQERFARYKGERFRAIPYGLFHFNGIRHYRKLLLIEKVEQTSTASESPQAAIPLGVVTVHSD